MKIKLLLMMYISFCGIAQAYVRTVTCVNKTGDRLAIMTVEKPLTHAQVNTRDMVWLKAGEEVTLTLTRRLVSWYQPGYGVGTTVMEDEEIALTFVKNEDQVKTIHGKLREFALTNSKYDAVIAQRKNEHEGEEDCVSCANRCYHTNFFKDPDFCECLDWCHDRSRDMRWMINPHTQTMVLASLGSKIGLSYADLDEYEDCYDCDTITHTTIYKTVHYH